jgi:ABC-type transport system involved in multi-copper enzyme maturation permease subunit
MALFAFNWKRNWMLIIFSMLFIATIQLLLIYFNSTLEIAPMLEMFLNQLSPQIMQSFGEDILQQVSVEGTVAFGLEHPLVITLITFISFNILSANFSSSSSSGMMEIILSHPIRRGQLLLSTYFFALLTIFLLILSAFFGAFLALTLFHEHDLTLFTKMLKSDINGFLLHFFIMNYALCFCIYFKDVTKAIRWSAVIALVFYFLDIISNFWEILNFTKYFNFFSYFEPQKIMFDYAYFYRDSMILLGSSVLLLIISLSLFKQKDIQ